MNGFTLHPMLEKDAIFITQLPLCRLLLSNDKQYPWFILVPCVVGIKDIYELSLDQQQQFLAESSFLSKLLMQHYNGDKLNVAAIGNICPQLHVHHIVRYKTDVAWPAPVWGRFPAIPYTDDEIRSIKDKLSPLFDYIMNKQ